MKWSTVNLTVHSRSRVVGRSFCSLVTAALLVAGAAAQPGESRPVAQLSWDAPGQTNPFLPGYYADPSLVAADGHIFLYATLDPWGGATLGCWESPDFKHWEYRNLNWPTKAACTSPTSGGAGVWAPSVIHAPNGRYYMYVSVGNEVWVGVAEHPLGPWKNALGDKPLIPGNAKPGFHMIDAECFVDTDGQAYVYWGSGWNWTNGHCFAAKLKPDMIALDGEARDVTPPKGHYFEGPFMVKRNGRYFLMYSDGKTISDTYCVRYSVGDTPFGPFTEAANSPILQSHRADNIVSPGHHAVFSYLGKDYIVYHRHSVPFVEGRADRQTCIDELTFTADGRIETVTPTHAGPEFARRAPEPNNLALVSMGATATASSSASDFYGPARVMDNNYATRWKGSANAKGASLQIDLGAVKHVERSEVLLEYAWKTYPLSLETSLDGQSWTTVLDAREHGIQGSPTKIAHPGNARFLRLNFASALNGGEASVWEWRVYGTP